MLFHPPSAARFFFNDTATSEIYTLSLPDALPIPHAVFSEPDDVRLPGARQIREKARMLFHPPSAARVAEGREHEFRFLERTVAVAERGPHAVFSEPDDVRLPAARQIGENPRMLLQPPSTPRVADALDHDF